jgi:hypothetical protein
MPGPAGRHVRAGGAAGVTPALGGSSGPSERERRRTSGLDLGYAELLPCRNPARDVLFEECPERFGAFVGRLHAARDQRMLGPLAVIVILEGRVELVDNRLREVLRADQAEPAIALGRVAEFLKQTFKGCRLGSKCRHGRRHGHKMRLGQVSTTETHDATTSRYGRGSALTHRTNSISVGRQALVKNGSVGP